MSQSHNRKSSKKYDTSENKKYEGTEITKYNAKEQSLSQRFGDSPGYTKPKGSPDLKITSENSERETSEDAISDCCALMPADKREKITIHFKNKAKLEGDGRSHRNATTTSPNTEASETNAFSDSGARRRKKELQDLKVLMSWEREKKKARAKHTKLKKMIVKHVLEQFEDTVLPTMCSSHHRKKPSSLSTFIGQQKTSKKPNPLSSDSSSQKLLIKKCKDAVPQTVTHVSPELPGKSYKEIKHVPLPELSECWKYRKQKEEPCPEPLHNNCSSRTCRKKWEEAVLHMNQNSRGLHHSNLDEPTKTTSTDQEMQIIEDLHAARVDKKIVLPVAEACGELTSMEIDLPDEKASKSSGIPSDLNTLIVIDTNIMISHLELIKSLKNTDIPGIGKFGFIIPWVVLQELDSLKKGKILANVAQKAVPAVHFIHTCLKNQDSKLWGQSVQLASQQTHGFTVENNDDRVLHCCLQCQKLFPQTEVVLLTDDKNLCNKAMVSEVKALRKAELVTALQKLAANSETCTWMLSKDAESKTLREESTDPLSGIILDLEKCLGEVLSSILQKEMQIAYGGLWTEVVYRRPPWTLRDLLDCYKKHWIAVFGMIIPRSFLSTITYLSAQLCKAVKHSHMTTERVLQETKMLLEIFSSRSDYGSAISQALASVNKLCETLQKIQSGPGQNSADVTCEKMEDVTVTQHTQAEAMSLPTEPSTQGNRHSEIWSVLEDVGNTMNLYGLELFQKLELSAIDTTQYRSSFKDAFLGLQKLMAAVNEILAGIQQVLAPNSSFQDVWTLYNFLSRNKINTSTTFTAEEFYDCVSQGMYKERLSIGSSQLVQLEHAIKQCYESVSLEAKNRGWL